MIKAVLFDLDGTLIDTEKYYRIYWPMACAEFGYTMTDQQALAMRSLGHPFAPRQLKDWFGEDLDYDAVRERRRVLMEKVLEEKGIQVKPGAREILRFLRDQGILCAVATATDPVRTKKYLHMVGLEDCFDRLISATMVAEGKPAPDIYRFACSELGLAPSECLAVEDSPNGVMSAYRAGCHVIMVPDQAPPEAEVLPYLDGVADSLFGVAEYLSL